jgi:hypothetical protein
VLAIFDDLDTILFMLPLKVIVSGFHWELGFDVLLLGLPLVAAWRYMHAIDLPGSWPYKGFYAMLIVAFCKGLHYLSKHQLEMEPIHLEVLLPAFVLGCIMIHHHEGPEEKRVSTLVSAVFMFCVGLSTPALTLDGPGSVLSTDMAGHIAAVSALMVLGKMFPLFCYRDEADWQTRLALSLGMCPRGEVGAGIIVISIHAGISGPAVELAVVCLVINLVLSGAFVTWTRQLTRASQERVAKLKEEAARAKAERRKAKKEALERRARRDREAAEELARENALLPKEVFTLNGASITVEPELFPAIMSAAPGADTKGAQSDSDAASSISRTISALSVSTAGIPFDNDMDIFEAARAASKSAPKMKRQQTSALEFSSQNNDKPVLIVIFTCNLLVGVVLSQVASAMLPHHDDHHDDHHDTEAVWYIITTILRRFRL